MRKNLLSYFAGIMTAVVVVSSVNVYAADINKSINVVLNKVNVSVNNQVVGRSGSDYTLDNGAQVPYSILYNGTTYLPVRKVAEILGKDVSFNSSTNTVGIMDKSITPAPTPAPTGKVYYYSKFPDVPDFGKFTGATLFYSTDLGYNYVDVTENMISGYKQLLRAEGYDLLSVNKDEGLEIWTKDLVGREARVGFIFDDGSVIFTAKYIY